MQTLLIGKPHVDLTGSKIVSNTCKPLTVVSGHECGNVPFTKIIVIIWQNTYHQHIYLGQEFLLVPFGGRNVGQYYKIVSSQSSTVPLLAVLSPVQPPTALW